MNTHDSTQKYTLVGLLVWCLAVVVRLTIVSVKCLTTTATPMEAADALEAALPLMAIGGSLAVALAPNALRRITKDVRKPAQA